MTQDEQDRADFRQYCIDNRVRFAPVMGSHEAAFQCWKKDRADELRRAEEAKRKVKITFKKKSKLYGTLEFDMATTHLELENAIKCVSWLVPIQAQAIKAVIDIVVLEKDFAAIGNDFAAFRG